MEMNEMDETQGVSSTNVRLHPMIHPPVDAPLCLTCQETGAETALFNPKCPSCRDILTSPSTTVAQLFAILRQWTSPVQQSLEKILQQMFSAGVHVNDRDGLTDMTMLHYACKSGCRGMGDVEESCRMVTLILSEGADPYIRCRWTNMAAIHYAAYFDVAPVLAILLKATKAIDVDSRCSEFDQGTPLHIAVRNLSYQSVTVLLQNGADAYIKDSAGKMPIDWLPDPDGFEQESETRKLVVKLKRILEEAEPPDADDSDQMISLSSEDGSRISRVLQAIGVRVGDKVIVGGVKPGTLRYCGPTLFADGIWAGVELDEAAGKNNGTVDGMLYFKCPPNYGIFAPIHKISRPGILAKSQSKASLIRLNRGKVDLGHVTARVDTGLRSSKAVSGSGSTGEEIQVSDRVLVAGKRTGVVMYIGETEFATGVWFGVKLDRPDGKNDGSVNGRRYFTCEPCHGVFAPPSRIQRLSAYVNGGGDEMNDRMTISASTSDIHRQMTTEATPSSSIVTPHKSILSNKLLLTRSMTTGSVGHRGSPFSSSASNSLRLSEGMSVLCSGEMGVIKFIGSVEFADGVWLGIELKLPKGKHDGCVQGRRYFACRPGHGLLVRPNKVSVRGINGSKLIFN